MQSRSLYNSLICAFIFTTLIISILYAIFVYNAMKYTEDDILTRRVEMEAQDYFQHYYIDKKSAKLPISVGLNSYTSQSSNLPDWLKEQPLGIRELHEKELHVGVSELPGDDGLLYIVLSEEDSSSFEQQQSALFLILVFVGVGITIVGLAIGVFLGKYITTPLNRLTTEIDAFDTNGMTQNKLPFYGVGRSDEVGALSRAFTQLVERLGKFLVREQQFTRHASHELRTPLTIINNALAVLRLDEVASDVKRRNIDRIDDATQDMGDLINTFLYLGREKKILVKERINISEIVQRSLEKYVHLNKKRYLQVATHISPNIEITSDAKLIQVLVDNIVRNMYLHSYSVVNISFDGKTLQVKNDVSTTDKSQATTFGLGIIERISRHCGLQTRIHDSNSCFIIEVEF